MNCPACQEQNPDTARFCAHCGAPLVASMRLPEARFCIHCGQPLPGVAPARASAPGSYTPKHLAEKILTSRAALEGERKQVTVLFADVENFTRLGERLDPEGLHELMDRVFAILLDAIHRYEGTVNQFTGDGVMALFGAPVALEDHALCAVHAALEIQRTMAATADEFRATFTSAPTLRIGLNTGRVVVGKIGDDLRMDYTAQGDTVNLAARLQALAEAGTVAMSTSTQRLVGNAVECMSLGMHKVKGKEQPVEVFRPLQVMSRTARSAVAETRLAPFVGREREIEALMAMFADVRAGRPRGAVLVGDAGVGKSRLLRELRRRIGDGNVRWFVGHSVPYGRSTPYRAIVEIVRATLRLTEGDSEEAAFAKLAKLVTTLGETGHSIGSALRWLLGIGEPDPALAVLSASDRKAAITRALDELTRRAATVPHVFVFEACQWLDPASQEYLVGAATRIDAGSVMFIFTCRPGDGGRMPVEVPGDRIVLRPLTPGESQSLVAGIAPDLSPDLVTFVSERTGGNPLFIEEVTRTVVETGAARIPPTVEDVLMARIDHLSPPVKAVLQTTSVVGRQFSRTLLAHVVDDVTALPAALDSLVAAGLVQREEDRPDLYTCAQPLVHEVTYEGLLNQHRKVLHRRIGEALEQMFGHRLAERVEDLARHFARAEDWNRAVRYHREAGRKAAALCANEQATRWLQRALDLLSRLPDDASRARQTIEVHLDLCRSIFQLGQLDEVLHLAREAERLAQHLGDEQRLGEVYAYVSNYHYMKGEPDLAIRYGRQCLSLGDQSETSRTRRAARQYLGTSYHVLGEYGMAEEILTEQVVALETTEWFDRMGPVNLSYVSSCGWLSFTLAELGEFPRAHESAERATRAAARAGHPYAQAIAATFTGLVWQLQGEVEQALPAFETSFHLCAEHQLEVWRNLASALLGHACVFAGKVEHGLDLLWEAMLLTDRLGVQAYRSLWMTYLAEGLVVGGQTSRAIETAERAVELAIQTREQGNHTRALHALGTASIQLGASGFDRAGACLRQAIEQAERLRMRPLVASCYFSLATLARKSGDEPEAMRFLTIAHGFARELGMRFWWERVISA